MPVTSLRKPCARPPEVAICGAWTIARLEAEAETRSGKDKDKDKGD
ncbi:hypothetical protein PYEL_43730 [Pseudomonas sp. URMO17WK12:I11]|nr:hypothetical protein PYEL_43730 [Pseudomonas sp. URMO17WK12:I11]